jgi:hypothetical protein
MDQEHESIYLLDMGLCEPQESIGADFTRTIVHPRRLRCPE